MQQSGYSSTQNEMGLTLLECGHALFTLPSLTRVPGHKSFGAIQFSSRENGGTWQT
jgi:hypothetical protein